MGSKTFLFSAFLIVCIQLATAGCPTEIFNCNEKRASLCAAQQCSGGLTCHINNCGGCRAECQPKGTVSIMSVGGGSMQGITESGTRPTAAAGEQQQPPSKPCACPLIYAPVCASDGKRFDNKCLAECAGARVADAKPDAQGNCSPGSTGSSPQEKGPQQQQPSCPCPRIYLPVCGDDGKVYNNKCLAECAKVKVLDQPPTKDRQCPNPKSPDNSSSNKDQDACKCPKINLPVCAADGKRFDNACLAKCVNAKLVDAKPDASGKCPGQAAACPCPRTFIQVCGADGKVYNNECLAKCAGTTSTGRNPVDGKCPQ